MRLLSELRFRLGALFRSRELESDLDDEIQFHLDQAVAKYQRQGVPADEARRLARLAFGGVEQIKEASRDARGLTLLDLLRQDLRYAFRSLRRQPGFTLAIILTLGLGIGINAVMFGVLDQLLLRDPPALERGDEVHRVFFGAHWGNDESLYSYSGYTRYLDLTRDTRSFDPIVAYQHRTVPVGDGADTREVRVGVVSASYFELFDAAPILGRVFTAEEDRAPDGEAVAVLGYGTWMGRYGGDRSVLGRRIKVGAKEYSIIGVMPQGFVGIDPGRAPVVFVPITTYAATVIPGSGWYTNYDWSWIEILARRRPGVSIAAADLDLTDAFRRSWERERSRVTAPRKTAEVARARAFVTPVQHDRGPLQSPVGRTARWVGGVTVVVLLIACANVANLMLARALRRRREIAVRLALGVSRPRLVLQLFGEGLVLALAGGTAGILLATIAGPVLRRLFLPDVTMTPLQDSRTLLFTMSATILTAVLTSITPILQARRTDLTSALRSGSRQGGRQRSALRTGLLLVQAAFSVVLLIGAGLFVRSLQRVEGMRLGFDVDRVIYLPLNLRGNALSVAARDALNQRLLDKAATLPGVERVSLGITTPFWDNASQALFVEGIDSTGRLGEFTVQAASPGYLETMGTRLLRGRGISAEDVAQAPLVMVISAKMAAALWPQHEPLGQCVRIGKETAPCTTVVGVVESIHQRSMIDQSGLQFYTPIAQTGLALSRNRFSASEGGGVDASLFIRTRGEATAIGEAIRRALQPEMPGSAYLLALPMRQIVDPYMLSWQLGAMLFVSFGGLALVLAAIGLYGVIAYDVTQRTQELGVRMALGARAPAVLRLVMFDGVRVAVGGIVAGSAIAFSASSWVQPLLFSQSARDPLVYGLIAVVLLGVALLASLVPALRAVRVNPSQALQSE
jgi:predicted permease